MIEPYIAALIGVYLIVIAIKNSDDVFITRRKHIRHIVWLLGRNGARILIFLLGILFIFGFLYYTFEPLLSSPY